MFDDAGPRYAHIDNGIAFSYTVECPRCGASYSYLKGESSKCPYCGSVVSSDRTGK